MGVTKDLVSGVWVGGDERSIHFRSWDMGQGSKTARPIWERYMRKIYLDESLAYKKSPFNRPLGTDFTPDCAKYDNVQSDSLSVEDSPWEIDQLN
jgi:penicillin-binding protein 1A